MTPVVDWGALSSNRLIKALVETIARKFQVGLLALLPSKAVFSLRETTIRSQEQLEKIFSSVPRNHTGLARFEARLLREVGVSLSLRGAWCGALLAGPIPDELTSTERDYLCSLLEIIAQEALDSLKDKQGEPSHSTRYPDIIGNSPKLQELFRLLDKVIESDSTVLIQGENGTGKELIAQAIHKNSSRKNRPFVVQNCSAFNDNLLDSELFGHKRGAFTGAVQDKRGLFEIADTGTFFLDEIGDMSPQLQVKLLRVLEEGTFLPVGETTPRHVDVRVIAATNRDLQKMVEEGTFREDLFYRIHVLPLVSPPLRDRRDDIPLLVEHFLKRLSKGQKKKQLSSACIARLIAYRWPGNIRELAHEIERLWVLSGEEAVISERLLSPRLLEKPKEERQTMPGAVEALERRMIIDSLHRNQWNKTKAATELGVSRRNLIRKCQEYKLEKKAR